MKFFLIVTEENGGTSAKGCEDLFLLTSGGCRQFRPCTAFPAWGILLGVHVSTLLFQV